MNSGKTVFAQLMDFIPTYEFRRCVARYAGSIACAVFLVGTVPRHGLRATHVSREFARHRNVPAGARRKAVPCGDSRSGFAQHAGRRHESRDWRIFADLARVLIAMARPLYAGEPLAVELEETAYALDCTTIDLCLSLFPWARYRRLNAAVKMHTLLDLRGSIPVGIDIKPAKSTKFASSINCCRNRALFIFSIAGTWTSRGCTT